MFDEKMYQAASRRADETEAKINSIEHRLEHEPMGRVTRRVLEGKLKKLKKNLAYYDRVMYNMRKRVSDGSPDNA